MWEGPIHLFMNDGDGTFSRLAHSQSVFVSGNYAYVAASGDNSLTIVDIASLHPNGLVVDGRVGVGTTTPASALEVVGDVTVVTSTPADVASAVTTLVGVAGFHP